MVSGDGGQVAVSFSTAGLPTEERIARWERHNSDALIGLRCRMLGESLLEATELNLQVGGIQLARVRGNPHVVERPSELIRSDPSDSIAIYFTLVGDAFFYHDDGVRTLRPGQLLVCDADRPFIRGFSGGLEELAIKIPRPRFVDATGLSTLTAPLVRSFGHGDGSSRALARLVDRALRPELGQQVGERMLFDLIAGVIGGRPVDQGAVHVTNAKSYIEDHITDPALDVSQIACAVGISERQLSRVFAATGESVPQYVMARRLERAHTLLAAAEAPSVAEVAGQAGFGSETYFSGVFKKRFGIRAVDLRRMSRHR